MPCPHSALCLLFLPRSLGRAGSPRPPMGQHSVLSLCSSLSDPTYHAILFRLADLSFCSLAGSTSGAVTGLQGRRQSPAAERRSPEALTECLGIRNRRMLSGPEGAGLCDAIPVRTAHLLGPGVRSGQAPWLVVIVGPSLSCPDSCRPRLASGRASCLAGAAGRAPSR